MNQIHQTYPFQLLPLPYKEDSLCPNISAVTLSFHHGKHLKTYVNNLNKVLEPYPMYHTWTLEALVTYYYLLPQELQIPVRNNAGGVYNHDFYFSSLKPITCLEDKHQNYNTNSTMEEFSPDEFFLLFRQSFQSYEQFKEKFKQSALSVFGSGYAWLVLNMKNELVIMTTPNQDCPLAQSLIPLLNIDVWEHAYYLDYQNRRNDFIDQWFELVNWTVVANRMIY